MAFEIGWKGEVEITHTSIETLGDKDAVKVFVKRDDGETGYALVFLSPKAIGMAKRTLKLCGFDWEKKGLAALVEDEYLLAGNRVPIFVDEYRDKPSIQIDTRRPPEPSILRKYDQLARKDDGAKAAPEPKPLPIAKAAHPAEPIDEDNIPF